MPIFARRSVFAVAAAACLLAAPTAWAADDKAKSTQSEGKWVKFDAAANTVTVKITKEGKGAKPPAAIEVKKGREATFKVNPTGSVLSRTSIAINGKKMPPATLFTELNRLGHDNGIGRLDLVENRFVGMKSRGVYETPGGSILSVAHRAIESLTLDREAAHLKDSFMPRYAELVYYGFWFSPEREMLQAMVDLSQQQVEGTVRLKLYKGNVIVTGRKSPKSLYSDALVTFEDDRGAYDQKDAAGFIRLNALRLRTLAARRRSQ